MFNHTSLTLYLIFLTHMSYINPIAFKHNFGFLFSNLNKLISTTRCKFDLFNNSLDCPSKGKPIYKYETPKYPPYPYYDAPKNLFYDTSQLREPNEEESHESEIQTEYMKNSQIKRQGNHVPIPDETPLSKLNRAIGPDFSKYVYSDKNPVKERIKVDLSEYDRLNPGFGPWPSYDELKANKMDVNTSMFFELDPSNPLHRTLQHKPLFRNEIKTIAEAGQEQLRWLERSRRKEWPLTYSEFSALPLDMREAYYKNRYPVSDPDERFLMVLNYRRALGKSPKSKNPLEFDLIESHYTYTPKESPVLDDLKNWDDPLESAWRLRANECISDCVSYGWPPNELRFHTGMDVYDITWLPGVVKVFVERTRNECDNITKDELELMLMKLEKRLEELDKEEYTEVLENHMVVLCTHPDESNVLYSRREWNENKGKKVKITMNDENRTEFKGIMLGSDNTFGIDIMVDDQKLTLPLPFVYQVVSLF